MIFRKRILLLAMVMMMGTISDPSFSDDHAVVRPIPPFLNTLFTEALENNHDLIALKQQLAAFKAESVSAGALDDPRLGIGLVNMPTDSFSIGQEPMTQKQITLAQKIPWFGKLDLRTRRAALNVEQQLSVLKAKQLALLLDIADAYYELGFTVESLKINNRLIVYLDQIVRIAETRYASGKGTQSDVLQAQVEQSRLIEQKNNLDRQQRAFENKINALLNRTTHGALEPPQLSALPNVELQVYALIKTALENNPELIARRTEIAKAKAEVDLAAKAYYPDPDFIIAYGQREDDDIGRDRSDFMSASVVFSLPVWSKKKQDRQLDAAGKKHEAAQAAYNSMAVQLPYRVDAAFTELEQYKQNYLLFSQAILVQARQWSESSRFSYENGKTEFNTMIAALLRELNLEQQAKRYLYHYYQQYIELQTLTGDFTPSLSYSTSLTESE